ncbi:unnamed protein product [Cuscuta epithymum]|uniref:Protein kinase domain-containing protein n=1 Tax=Cuscuta epithymum TaxID=186058 RepID=A0AAV0CT07_9ASTE|nr:unnamed protein product [Cuscuta epithymum]
MKDPDSVRPNKKIKIVVSFNGTFRRQPPAGRLRYSGGESKIISVDQGVNFSTLESRVTDLIMQANGIVSVQLLLFSLRYHLSDSSKERPLVQLSSDDDVSTMIEEFVRLERMGKPTRLWVFVCFDNGSNFFPEINGVPHKKPLNGKNNGFGKSQSFGGEKGKKLSDNSLRKLVLKQQLLGKRFNGVKLLKGEIRHTEMGFPVIDLSSEGESSLSVGEFYDMKNGLEYERNKNARSVERVENLKNVSDKYSSDDLLGHVHLNFGKGYSGYNSSIQCLCYDQFGSINVRETTNVSVHPHHQAKAPQDMLCGMEKNHDFRVDYGRPYVGMINGHIGCENIKNETFKKDTLDETVSSTVEVALQNMSLSSSSANVDQKISSLATMEVDQPETSTQASSTVLVGKGHQKLMDEIMDKPPSVLSCDEKGANMEENAFAKTNGTILADILLYCAHMGNGGLQLQRINKYELEYIKELGSGSYGTVYYGKWKGSDVAIKRLKPSCFSDDMMEDRLVADFWKEAHILGGLHHPNVVALYGVVTDGPVNNLETVTEYMANGSLKQVLRKRDGTIDYRKRLIIALDAAFGMEYLHQKNVIHFDLKSHNILVNMRDPLRPICKIGDLGLSKIKRSTLVSGGVRGTIPWMAPELLSCESMVSEKVDVYSFGIVMWELLTGAEPYSNMRTEEIICGIIKGCLRPEIPYWCHPAWRHLMERCWSSDPKARPAFSDIAKELRGIASSMNIL